MNSGIFIIQDGGQLLELKEKSYLLEGNLQRLLADYPNLILGDQIHAIAPRHWLFVAREANLPAIEGGLGHHTFAHAQAYELLSLSLVLRAV
jgi:hypothetical protein